MKLSDLDVKTPKGATLKLSDLELLAPEPEKGIGEQINEAVADVPRQVGMFARFGLEGVANVADLATLPMRAVYDPLARATGMPTAMSPTDMASKAADVAGLPKPQSGIESVAGDITRTMVGTGGALRLADRVAQKVAPGVTQRVAQSMVARPDLQLSAAAGAGTAGGVVRETGGNDLSQFLAALAGGLAAPTALHTGQRAVAGVKNLSDKLLGSPNLNLQIDAAIENAVKPSGLTLADIPANVRIQLHEDIKQALKTGNLSPDATRRLADYRLIGATPTAANLTLDPVAITQQRNLAKIGANSKDPSLQKLAQIQNQNNRLLTERLNDAGAQTDPVSASEKVIQSLMGRDAAAKSVIDKLYQSARATDGRSAVLDPSAFTQKANDMLDEALLGGKLPGDVRNKLNAIASGEMPFTVDVAEQLKTNIAALQRASKDGAERLALGKVREALEATPLLDGQGQQAIDAFNKARTANRAWMQVVERTPALQAVRDGAEPDKFVQNFVIGGTDKASNKALFNLQQQIKNDPEAMTAVKGAITNFLKTRALNMAQDETGNFSQSAYNKALMSIGERKLAMFFSPQEVAQLKAIGRVASYEQFQPVGSAVNNSNTATTLVSTLLDRIGNSAFLRKIPLGAEFVGNPAKSISMNVKATQALNVPKALINKEEVRRLPPVLLPLLIEQHSNN